MSQNNYNNLYNWLKLKHLLLIKTLSQTQNMHKAAEMMNLSQPALSKMLKEIEEHFGFEIFERQLKKMVLTALGMYVLEYSQRTLNDTETFIENIQSLHQGGHGFLKIGGIFAATASIIPTAIIQIKQKWPLLSIEVVEQPSGGLLKMLQEKSLDLAIARFTEEKHKDIFDFQALGPEVFCIVVNADHPLSQQKESKIEDLLDWTWILYPKDTPIHHKMEAAFHALGLKVPANIITTISMQTFLQVLQNGSVIGMLPEAMVRKSIEEGRLYQLNTDLQLEPQVYGIITRKNEVLSAHYRAFISLLKQPNLT